MKKELKRKLHTEELHGKKGKYIRSTIFGWQDGIVSAMALLAGLTGAALEGVALSDFVIILATLAEIFAGSISMSFGTYIGTKSQIEVHRAEIEREKAEIEEEPKKEEAELREFYRAKGFTPKEIEIIVRRLKKNKAAMLDVMIKEELGGYGGVSENPFISALYMFVFYAIGGFIPLSPFLFLSPKNAIGYAIILTAIALFGIGAAKTYLTGRNWIKSGLEILIIGLLATAGAYLIGTFLGGGF